MILQCVGLLICCILLNMLIGTHRLALDGVGMIEAVVVRLKQMGYLIVCLIIREQSKLRGHKPDREDNIVM